MEKRKDILFFTYPQAVLPPLSFYILLTLDAPLLTPADKDYGLLLIDGTWKHASTMFQQLPKPHLFQRRSLPSYYQTAYPRRQDDCPDPFRGLASIEALYIAYYLLGRDTEGLLDHYYWREAFIEKNSCHFVN